MSAREAVFDMLKARLDNEHANRCLDAYRAEVLREAAREFKGCAPLVFSGAEIALILEGLKTI